MAGQAGPGQNSAGNADNLARMPPAHQEADEGEKRPDDHAEGHRDRPVVDPAGPSPVMVGGIKAEALAVSKPDAQDEDRHQGGACEQSLA